MSIQYAILGLLSWKPATGYDLKKIFETSSALYWSGNNNQIYKSLLELQNNDLVSHTVEHPSAGPSKKIYSITEKGLSDLKQWVLSKPSLPEFRKSILLQLAWSDRLSKGQIDELLQNYERQIHMHLMMEQEKQRRNQFEPARTQRETFLWDMINDNLISSYKNELGWVQRVRMGLAENDTPKDL